MNRLSLLIILIYELILIIKQRVVRFDVHGALFLFNSRDGNFDIFRRCPETPLKAYVTEFSTSLATSTDRVVPDDNGNAKSSSGNDQVDVTKSSSDNSNRKKFSFDEEFELANLLKKTDTKKDKNGKTIISWAAIVKKVYHYYY